MKKNLFINLIFMGILAAVAFISLLLALCIPKIEEFASTIFFFALAAILLSCGEMKVVITKYSGNQYKGFIVKVLKFFGFIGPIISCIFGALSILLCFSDNNYLIPIDEDSRLFVILGSTLFLSYFINKFFTSISFNFKMSSLFENYGYIILMPIIILMNIIFINTEFYKFMTLFLINAGAIIIIKFVCDDLRDNDNLFSKIANWIVIIIPIIFNLMLFPIDFEGIKILVLDNNWKLIIYYSCSFYIYVGIVLYLITRFVIDSLLYKLNKNSSLLNYLLIPLISYIITILAFKYWMISLILFFATIVIFFIIGFIGLIIVFANYETSDEKPKKHLLNGYELEKAMSHAIYNWDKKILHYEIDDNGEDYPAILHIYYNNNMIEDQIIDHLRKTIPNEIILHYIDTSF